MSSYEDNRMLSPKNSNSISDEFLTLLRTTKKNAEKKQMVEDLILFLAMNPNYILSDDNFPQFEKLFEVLKALLNENNMNFILVELNLLKIISNNFKKKNNKTKKFFSDILPKLFDKFYLQNPKINSELIDLFDVIVENNLGFNEFFPLIENISADDDDYNYRISLMQFIYNQISKYKQISFKQISPTIVELLKKMSVDSDNQISDLAFNALEILNGRNFSEGDQHNKEQKEIKEGNKNNLENSNNEYKIKGNLRNEDDDLLIRNMAMNEQKNKPRQEINNYNDEEEGLNNFNEQPQNNHNFNDNYNNNEIEEIDLTNENNNQNISEDIQKNKIESSQSSQKFQIRPRRANRNFNVFKRKASNTPIEEDNTKINNNLKEELQQEPMNVDTNQYMTYDNTVVGKAGNNQRLNEDKPNSVPQKNQMNYNEFDEMPVGGKNRKISNFNSDENETGNNQNNIENKPEIKNNDDERPIKPRRQENRFQKKFSQPVGGNNPQSYNDKFQMMDENDERPLNVGRNTNQNDKFQMMDENDERPLNVGKNNPQNYNDKFQMMDENDERPIKPMFKNNFDDDPIPALKNKITPQDLEEDIINEFPNNINEEPFEEEVKEEPPKEKKSSKQTVLKDDPKFDIIKEILGPEIANSLDSQKWEEKKEGLESIYQFLSDNETNLPFRGEDLFDYLKFKLKNFKETNFNLVKEALNIFSYLIQNKLISNDLGTLVLNTYYEKLSDIKLKEQTMQFILAFIDSTDPNSVLKNVISKLKRKSNPKLLMEYGTLFEKIIEDFNISELPIFELVDICKTMAANANPKVRTSATTLLCALYKYIGPDLKNMIKDIKESTRKNIEAELDKIIVETAPPSKQTKKSMNIKIENENTNGSNDNNKPINLELIPRVDISKKINQNLIKAINDGKWQEKKEAADAIEKILNDANNKILPNGLNNYFNMIKNKLGDGGKNVVRMAISLLSKSIDALGVGFKQYSKPLAMALVPNLSDKMPILREDCQNCMDKWVNNIGINDLINVLPQFLKTDNIEIRTEIFKFLTKNKDKIGKGNEYFFSENVLPLLYCLQDKSSNVRNSAETQIIYSLKYINLSKYTESLSEFKPAIQNDLLLVLNRLANMEEEEDDEEENITPEINNVNNGATGNEKEEIKIEEKKIQPHQQLKVIKKNKLQASEENLNGGNNKNNSNNKLGTVNNQGETNTNTNNSNTANPNTNANNTATTTSPHNNPPQKHESAKAVGHNSNSKPKVKKQNTPLIKSTVYLQNITNNKNVKDKRIDSDKKYKFTLDNCNNESLHKFKDSLKGVFLDDFLKKFCSDDFKSFIESINNLKGTLDRKENINNFLDNLDLILKVLGIRLSSSQNPSLLKSAFEFLDTLEETLKSQNYEMNDIETNVLLTILIDKLTILNSSLKEQVLLLINKFINLIGQNKATLIIISTAIKRNAKIKSEVIELIIDMYMNTDIDIANKSYIKLFGRLLLTNDNNIKAKIIGLFKEIYAKIGTEIWNYLTDIPEKERKFLETNLIEMDNEEEEAEGEEDEEAEGEEAEEEEEVDETEASNQVVPQKKIENKKQNLNEDEEEEPKPADDTKAKNIIVISKQQLSKNNKASHSIEKKNNYTTNTNKNTSNTNTVPPNMRKIVVQQKSTNAPNNYGTANVSSNKPNQNTKGKIIITSVPSKKPNPPTENKNSTNSVQSQLNYAPSDGTLTDKNDLIKIINGLKEKDLSIKVNTIIIIHELICTNKYEENKTILIDNIDYIINTFIEALKVLFPDKTNLADIPIKFAKYLATVLCKISSNKELISNIKYETLFSLAEELLSNLLIENLSTIGDNKEGNIIFKSLNSTMLRILENVNSTHVIVALLEIVKIYRNNEEKAKLAGLAIKCLLKLNQNLETIINTIEVDKILLQIHLIITDLEKIYPDLIPKTQTEQITIKFAKNLINEIVKIKKRAILADYKKGLASREIQDKYILKWIKNYLNIMSQSENFETNETNEPISPKNESANEGSSTNVSAANTSSPGNSNPSGVMHVKRNSGLESGGLGKASSKTKATLPTGISNFKHTSGESANIKSFAEMRYKYNFMNKKKPAQKKK